MASIGALTKYVTYNRMCVEPFFHLGST